MIEVLLSLVITLIIITSLTGFIRLIRHSQDITNNNEDIYIAAKQVSQYVLGTQYIQVDSSYTYVNYSGEEVTLQLDNHRLVKKPGFEIILMHIDELYFEIEENFIYMVIEREEKEYRFLINIAKEKEIEEENDETLQTPE